MTVVLVGTLVLLVGLAAVYWSYGPDAARLADVHARPWRRAALLVMGLYAAFLLLMGAGEMTSGDVSGFIHFVPVAMLALLAYLAGKRPRETGIVLTVVGLMAMGYFAFAGRADLMMALPAIAVGGLPWFVAGVLLLAPEFGHHAGPRDHVQLGV